MSFRLEVPGPSKRMTIGSMTHVTLHEDALGAGLRFPILAIVAQVVPGSSYIASPQHLANDIKFFYHMIESGETSHARVFIYFFQLKHS